MVWFPGFISSRILILKEKKKKTENTHTTKGLVAWDRPVVPEVRIAAGNEGHKT